MQFLQNNRFLGALSRFSTQNYFHTLVILFAAIVFTFFTSKDYIPAIFRMIMPWVLLFAVLSTNRSRQAWLVLLASIMLVINVILNFYVSANHGFMIAYIGLALMICLAAQERGTALMEKLAAYFLTALMGLALIQKLASPNYMSGDLLGYYVLSGNMFKVLISLFYPDWMTIVHENNAAVQSLQDMAPQGMQAADIVVPAGIGLLIMALTYVSLATQAVMELCLFLRARLGVWTHYMLLLFVVIIYTTRNENIFLSMNCILGYAMTNEQTKSARPLYVIWIFYLLVMELAGVRPGILV